MNDAYVVLVFIVGAGTALAVEHFILPRVRNLIRDFKAKARMD